jgi:hypothetical protein
MSQPKMSQKTSTPASLFKLPTIILNVIFSKYLTLDSVIFLDIAVAESGSRKVFLLLFQSPEFVFEDNRDRYGRDFLSWSTERGKELCSDSIDEYITEQGQSKKDAETFLSWLQKRRVLVKHVSLIGWRNITDAGMRVLGESSSRLESLTMYNCENIHDQGIEYLAKGCSGLKQF